MCSYSFRVWKLSFRVDLLPVTFYLPFSRRASFLSRSNVFHASKAILSFDTEPCRRLLSSPLITIRLQLPRIPQMIREASARENFRKFCSYQHLVVQHFEIRRICCISTITQFPIIFYNCAIPCTFLQL